MSLPVCAVNKAAARRLRSGHPWAWRQEVVRPAEAEGGSVVRVTDERGNLVGSAFWAANSPLAIRLLSREDHFDPRTLADRALAALDRRRRLFPRADAFRVVHGEADLLPGFFVDRYGDGLAFQLLAEGAERHFEPVREALVDALQPRVVVLRNDTSARSFEGLERFTRQLAGEDPRCRYHEGENLFEVDLIGERKTGAFLDQQENHLRAAEYARGEALDTFTYHGGFALSLARRAETVLALDQDEVAAGTAQANADRNGLKNVTVRAENAFDALHGFDREGRRFDTIVIDPPAFAKRKEGLATATRAYRELNLRGLRILNPGGVLISCSCSGKLRPDAFEEMLLDAARDARRAVQILERRGAGRDHPALAGLPETEYLKCFVLQVVDG